MDALVLRERFFRGLWASPSRHAAPAGFLRLAQLQGQIQTTWWGRAACLVGTCDLWSFMYYGSPSFLQDLPLLPWKKNELILPEKPFPP